ncbi:MAG: hypothetical protein E3J86_14175 [Candidatus Thorarchaeota archaeon]|nr:MAG: hypothetical protein E3J86_14175 [Candidatus Thorarchaeota archaeon]
MEDGLQGIEPSARKWQDGTWSYDPVLSCLSCALRGEGLVYHGTCKRRSFMKTITESLVAVITFDNVTSRHHIDVRPEDEMFKAWSCVSCRKPLFDEVSGYHADMEESLDLKLKRWREKEDLCHVSKIETWNTILRSL